MEIFSFEVRKLSETLGNGMYVNLEYNLQYIDFIYY